MGDIAKVLEEDVVETELLVCVPSQFVLGKGRARVGLECFCADKHGFPVWREAVGHLLSLHFQRLM